MRSIFLMADYQCHPLWETTDGMYQDVNPHSLPISKELASRLEAWGQEYDSTLNLADPASSGFATPAERMKFFATGHELLLQLKIELGSDFSVDLRSVG